MDGKQDVEVVNAAIQRLIEDEKAEKRTRQGSVDGDLFGVEDDGCDEQLLLKLLSRVEDSKGCGGISQIPPELIPRTKEAISDAIAAAENSKSSEEKIYETTNSTTEDDIMKELKKVRRQNTITHWLLSIMIVLTVTWQLSEVSFILKVKNGISHPFQTIGNTLTGMLNRGKKGKDKVEESLEQLTDSIPSLKMPDLKIDMKGLTHEAIENSRVSTF